MKKKILHEFWGINATSVVENTAGKKPRNVLDLSSINVSKKVDTVLEKYKSYSSILSIRYFLDITKVVLVTPIDKIGTEKQGLHKLQTFKCIKYLFVCFSN